MVATPVLGTGAPCVSVRVRAKVPICVISIAANTNRCQRLDRCSIHLSRTSYASLAQSEEQLFYTEKAISSILIGSTNGARYGNASRSLLEVIRSNRKAPPISSISQAIKAIGFQPIDRRFESDIECHPWVGPKDSTKAQASVV